MKTNSSFTIGFVICLVLAGYYGYLVISSLRTKGKASPTRLVNTNLFSEAVFRELGSLNINGALPFSLGGEDLGNPNPF